MVMLTHHQVVKAVTVLAVDAADVFRDESTVLSVLSTLYTLSQEALGPKWADACSPLVDVLDKYAVSVPICEQGLVAVAALCRTDCEPCTSRRAHNIDSNIEAMINSGASKGNA
jgi:hypothetical protein